MFNEIKDDIKKGGVLTILIAVIIVVFVLLNVIPALFGVGDAIHNYLAFPASFNLFLHRPWTIITYAFLHAGPLHILFNMMILYVSGDILQGLIGRKHIWPIFFYGAVFGAFTFMAAYNLFPFFRNHLEFSDLVGASAGVMAILIAATTLTPDYKVIFLMVRLPLKIVALIFIIIDLVSLSGGNAGGHFSHLGGALMGYFYVKQLQNGINLGKWFQFDFVKFKNRKKFQVHKNDSVVKNADRKPSNEIQLNKILEKISASGYTSLTQSEKDFLDKYNQE